MEGTRVINQQNKTVLVFKLSIAHNFWSRLKGLLGTRKLEAGKGLLICPCSSVHTFGMHYPIDVLFLDRNLKVLKILSSLPAMRAGGCLGSYMALELPGGTAAKTSTVVGDHLDII